MCVCARKCACYFSLKCIIKNILPMSNRVELPQERHSLGCLMPWFCKEAYCSFKTRVIIQNASGLNTVLSTAHNWLEASREANAFVLTDVNKPSYQMKILNRLGLSNAWEKQFGNWGVSKSLRAYCVSHPSLQILALLSHLPGFSFSPLPPLLYFSKLISSRMEKEVAEKPCKCQE